MIDRMIHKNLFFLHVFTLYLLQNKIKQEMKRMTQINFHSLFFLIKSKIFENTKSVIYSA
jgi:hypothetical protein